MVKIKTNNKHMSMQELDITKEEAVVLVNTGNYIYVEEQVDVVVEEPKEEEVVEEKEEE